MKLLSMKMLFFTLLTSLLLISCSKKKFHIEEVNGIKVYKNKNIPNDPDFNVKITQDGSIKLDDYGTCEYYDVNSNGDIYIYSKTNGNILKFDNTLKYKNSFGRTGTGPGEYTVAKNISIFKDSVYVSDTKGMKFVKYDSEGNFCSNLPLIKYMPLNVTYISDSLFAANLIEQEFKETGVYISSSTSLMNKKFEPVLKMGRKTFKFDMSNPFTPYDLLSFFCVNPVTNDISCAENSENDFRIKVYDSKGQKKYEIKKAYKKTYYSDKEKSSLGILTKSFKKKGGGPDFSRMKVKKAINSIYYDVKGRLWSLTSRDKNSNDSKAILFDIFEDGVFLNTVPFNGIVNDNSIRELDIISGLKFRNDKIYFMDSDKNCLNVYSYK